MWKGTRSRSPIIGVLCGTHGHSSGAVDESGSRHFPRYIERYGPLYLTSRLAPRLPRIYIAPFRPQFTSGYQVLAGERRACKFMRDAVHCFRREVERRGCESRERRQDRSRPLQRDKKKVLFRHTIRCPTIRKIYIPQVEDDIEDGDRFVIWRRRVKIKISLFLKIWHT